MTANSIIRLGLLIVAAMLFYTSSFSSNVYTKETDLLPIRLSDTELQKEIDKISNLIRLANAGVTKGYISLKGYKEGVTFVSGKTKIEISGHRFLSAEVGIPKASYGFQYDYHAFFEEAPITVVSLDFRDEFRTIRITGNSPDQVDAIFSTIESDFAEYSTFIGGSGNRVTGEIILLYLFSMGLIGGLIYCVKSKKTRHIGIPISSAIGLILIFTLPFKDILAGFAVYRGEASFIVRYGYQISFASLLITLLAIPLSYFIPLIFSEAKNSTRRKEVC
jgi:hypothetical protein